MRLNVRIALGICAVILQTNRPFAAQQRVLVLCAGDKCDYRPIASFLVGGRQSIRLSAASAEKTGPSDIKNAREVKIDQIVGLYRDGVSGVFYALGTDGKPHEVAVPLKAGGKEAVTPAAVWRGEVLEYSDAPNAKSKNAVTIDSFAYLLVSPDGEQAVFRLLQQLLEPGAVDAWGNLGIAQQELGRKDEAIQTLKDQLALSPTAGAALQLAQTYLMAGRFDEMESALQAAARLEPDNGFVHTLRGDRFAKEGRTREAISEYEEALRLDPYRVGLIVKPLLTKLRAQAAAAGGARRQP